MKLCGILLTLSDYAFLLELSCHLQLGPCSKKPVGDTPTYVYPGRLPVSELVLGLLLWACNSNACRHSLGLMVVRCVVLHFV